MHRYEHVKVLQVCNCLLGLSIDFGFSIFSKQTVKLRNLRFQEAAAAESFIKESLREVGDRVIVEIEHSEFYQLRPEAEVLLNPELGNSYSLNDLLLSRNLAQRIMEE